MAHIHSITCPLPNGELLWEMCVRLEIYEWNQSIHLGAIEAVVKGRGDGTRCLQSLFASARAFGVTIKGDIHPFSEGGLSLPQLVQWYAKHGAEIEKKCQRFNFTF